MFSLPLGRDRGETGAIKVSTSLPMSSGRGAAGGDAVVMYEHTAFVCVGVGLDVLRRSFLLGPWRPAVVQGKTPALMSLIITG